MKHFIDYLEQQKAGTIERITAYDCKNLKSIENIENVNVLILDRTPIEDLGSLKIVNNYLSIEDCSELKTLKNITSIGLLNSENFYKGLMASRSGLVDLGAVEEIKGFVNLNYCKNLQTLKKLKKANYDLSLTDCTSLVDLGALSYVNQSLILTGCKSLKKLPENLHIRGDLYIKNSGLKTLPLSLKVDSYVVDASEELIKNNKNDKIKFFKSKGFKN